MTATLWYIPSSLWRGPRTPHNMEEMVGGPPGCRETTERIALQIFADVCNANHSFQSALAAIYMSGLYHGVELSQEKQP